MLNSTSNSPYKLMTAPVQLRKSTTLRWAFHTGLHPQRSKRQLARPGPNWRHPWIIQHDILPSTDLKTWSLLRSPLTQVDIRRPPAPTTTAPAGVASTFLPGASPIDFCHRSRGPDGQPVAACLTKARSGRSPLSSSSWSIPSSENSALSSESFRLSSTLSLRP